MKTFNRHSVICLSTLLLFLASTLTASAVIQHKYVTHDGFMYEITYDSDYPYEGTATMIGRDCDMETNTYCPIQYEDWNTDSILVIPDKIGVFTLTAIDGGFGWMNDIKTIYIPATVTRIARGVFSNSSLEEIYFFVEWGSRAPITFENNPSSEFPNQNGVFQGCKRLTTVIFDRPVNQLIDYMFMNCSKLENIDFYNINSSLDTIGVCAFANCTSLKNIDIPNSIKVIDKGAFIKCSDLENINIPNGITTIGDYAFADCLQLNNISLSPSLQSIGEASFLNCRSLTSINIPSGVTTIKDFTFYDCQNLTDINLNHVTTFGERSFAGCNKLTSIDLTMAQSIGMKAFFGERVGCDLMDPPTLRIGGYSESWDWGLNLGSLKKIILGKEVSVINEQTFMGHIPDTITCMAPVPPTYGGNPGNEWIFSLEAYATSVLCVPRVVVNNYREAYGWSQFANIEGIEILGNGDANGDGQVSISDVTALIDQLLGNQADAFDPINADVNGDGSMDIKDVTVLIDMLLSGN